MDENYKKSLTEVYEILKIMPESILNRIPQKLKDIIEKERDINYKVIIKEPLNTSDFKYETVVFLGMLYRDFLCSEEERKKLKSRDEELIKKYETQLRRKYNPDNLFAKKENIQEQNNLPLNVEEKKWYKKIFNFIKGIFK